MFKLIKIGLLSCLVIAAGYLLLGVRLGEKTLYQHLAGIAETSEAKSLTSEIGKKVDGATENLKEKAADLAIDNVKKRLDAAISKDPEESAKGSARKTPTAETEAISTADRVSLNTLIRKKQSEEPREDRASLDRLIGQKTEEHP